MVLRKLKMGFIPICAILMLSGLSQAQIPEIPSLFLKDDVSTRFNERDMAISPDGSEMFYTLLGNQNSFSVILHRTKRDNTWAPPEVASFSGKYADLEPAFSADGKKIFFSSNRPLEGEKAKDYDIWSVEKINGVWSNPKNLGPIINTAANEFYPSLGASGNLYFTAEYKSGIGKEDIFMAAWKDGKYEPAVVLDTAVNSILWEFNAFVSPDEKFIIFTSYGRMDDSGGGDLYISIKDAQGKWQSAQNIKMLNSTRLDYCPFVSFDKSTLFFTSAKHSISKPFAKTQTYSDLIKTLNQPDNASENIYWVSFKKVMESLEAGK